MLIGKNWKIESDNLNVIISQKKGRKRKDTGERYLDWQVVGYYSTVANALHGMINQKVRDSELKDLKTITKSIDELHNLVDRHFKPSRAKIKPVKEVMYETVRQH